MNLIANLANLDGSPNLTPINAQYVQQDTMKSTELIVLNAQMEVLLNLEQKMFLNAFCVQLDPPQIPENLDAKNVEQELSR